MKSLLTNESIEERAERREKERREREAEDSRRIINFLRGMVLIGASLALVPLTKAFDNRKPDIEQDTRPAVEGVDFDHKEIKICQADYLNTQAKKSSIESAYGNS